VQWHIQIRFPLEVWHAFGIGLKSVRNTTGVEVLQIQSYQLESSMSAVEKDIKPLALSRQMANLADALLSAIA
jgi:hypothetical protein